MLALVAALVLSADPASCTADGDCVLITGCDCACCPLPLKAVNQAEAERMRRRCATLGDCGDTCRPGELKTCAPPEDPATVKAVCRAGRCVKEPAPKPECTTDADCAMERDCPCDCCPAPWLAMPKAKADALRRKCARLGPCRPSEVECQGVTCAPSRDATAVCHADRCEAVPVPAKR